MKNIRALLCLAALFCFGVCRVSGGAREDFKRLSSLNNSLQREKARLKEKRDRIGKGMSLRYPLGMSDKAVYREKAGINEKIGTVTRKIEEIREKLYQCELRIVEIEIADERRENDAEFWEFSIFVNGARICGAPRSNRRLVRERDVAAASRPKLTFREQTEIKVTHWYIPEIYNLLPKKELVERDLFTKIIRVEEIDFDSMEYEIKIEIDREYNKTTLIKGKLLDKFLGPDAIDIKFGSGANDVHGTFRLRVKFDFRD